MPTKASGATRDDQHSLVPIQLATAGLERDLGSLAGGQSKRLMLAMLGSVVAMAGLLLWMTSGDGHHAYAAAAKQLDSLYAQHESAFERCALLQPQESQVVLRTAIETASQSLGKAYAEQLAPCSQALALLDRQLAELDVPMSMTHRFEGLRHTAHALNRAIGSYRAYLFDPKRSYDAPTAATHIDNVVIAWSNYEVQRKNTLEALHEAAQPH